MNLLKRTITIIVPLLLALGACKKNDPEPPTDNNNTGGNGTGNTATIGNTSFNPTKSVAFTDEQGKLTCSFTEGTRKISFTTSGEETGEYAIQAPNLKLAKTTSASTSSASVIIDSDIFYATEGNVTITLNTDGKLSGSYSFKLENSSGQALEVNGSFADLSITQPAFLEILTSKAWNITKYEFEDKLNGKPIRDFYNTSIHTRNSEISPDPCNWSGTITSPQGTWKNYLVGFSSGLTIGTFSYDFKKVNWEQSSSHPDTCRIVYTTASYKDNIINAWTYDEANNILKTSFGELYEILDDQPQYLMMEYKVVSFSSDKIVLEGKQFLDANDNPSTSGELFLISNITLE